MIITIHKNTQYIQPYWFTISSGSNILAHSEMYVRKTDAINAIASIMQNAGTSDYQDKTGER